MFPEELCALSQTFFLELGTWFQWQSGSRHSPSVPAVLARAPLAFLPVWAAKLTPITALCAGCCGSPSLLEIWSFQTLPLKKKKKLKNRVLFPLGNPQHSLSLDLNLGPGCAKQTEGCPTGAAKISFSYRGNFTVGIPARWWHVEKGGQWSGWSLSYASLGAAPLLSSPGGTWEGDERLHQDDLNH